MLSCRLNVKVASEHTAREHRLCFGVKTVLKLPLGNMDNIRYVTEQTNVTDSVLVFLWTMFSCWAGGKSEKIRSSFFKDTRRVGHRGSVGGVVDLCQFGYEWLCLV